MRSTTNATAVNCAQSYSIACTLNSWRRSSGANVQRHNSRKAVELVENVAYVSGRNALQIDLADSSVWRDFLGYDRPLQETKSVHLMLLYTTGWSKKLTPFVLYGFLYALISSNIDRFSNIFHCLNQKNICNNTVATDPTTPQLCRYATL